MFVSNGFVCGGKPINSIRITGLKCLSDRMMLLTFNNGETRLFDSTLLHGPVYEPLDDDDVFRNAVLDHGVVTWMDGEVDCAPEFMYDHSYEYEIAM